MITTGTEKLADPQGDGNDSLAVGDNETRRSLAHDLRHALFALRTGIDLLPQVRGDAQETAEIHALLKQEIANASKIAEQLLQDWQQRGPSKSD